MIRRIGAFLIVSFLALTPFAAAEAGTLDQAAVEQIVHDYLLSHPDVLLQALQAAEDKANKDAEEKGHAALTKRYEELVADARDPSIGNPKGDVTVIEFFDYRCPYCKQVAPALLTLVTDDKQLRIVFKEFPILGADSKFAARAALGALKQGRYQDFHMALMKTKGQLNEEAILGVAQSVGLDIARLKTDMNAPEAEAVLKHNFELGDALNIKGTPAFIVGGEVIPGAVDIDTLKKKIAAARKRG